MAIGDGAQVGARSYAAIGKETTFGTYASATTAIEAISSSIKTEIESQKLETMNTNRGMTKRVQLMKNVTGSIETYLQNQESVLFLLAAAGPNTVTSTALSGSAVLHSFASSNLDTFGSLSMNIRKGDTATWRYTGGRVNVLTIAGTVGEPVRMTAEMIFKDSTQQSDDISGNLSISSLAPWVYHQGQFIYAATTASLTTTNAEPIQSFELVITNNIVSDANARQLGSLVPGVLPATSRSVELKITQRFDTTTAFDRFIQGTQGSIRLQFDGSSIATALAHQLVIDMPKVFVSNAPDPELAGPGEVITNEIEFDVVVDDPNTTTGKDIGFTIQNDVASY